MDRQELVGKLRSLFETRGFEGATLSEIARVAGLSKASLYHHFPDGKAGMGLALLEDAGARLDATVLAPLRGDNDPAARIAAMVDGARTYFADGERSCLLTVFALGPPDPRFDTLVKARLDGWIDALADVLMEAGAPKKEARRSARDAVARIQGASVLARGTGNPKVFRQVIKRVAADLERTPPGRGDVLSR
jgi:AcrR family transcriptional regulator